MSTTIHLTAPGDQETWRGLTLRLVDYDPQQKSASIWFSSRGHVERAHEGAYFGESKAVRLERVGEDGVDLYVEAPLPHR